MIGSVIAVVAVGAYVHERFKNWSLKKNLTAEVQNLEAEFSALRTKVTSAGVVIVEKDFDGLLAVGRALAAKL
jgi:hypothetical protein